MQFKSLIVLFATALMMAISCRASFLPKQTLAFLSKRSAFHFGPFQRVGLGSSFRAVSTTNTTNSCKGDIVLQTREYGYRTSPFNWTELVQIIDVEKNLAKLSRSVKQQTEYQIHTRDLKSKWRDPHHYILHSKFGLEKRLVKGTDGELWETDPPVSTKEPALNLSLNDFPYFTAPGIYHYVLWKIGGDVTDQEIEHACKQIRSELGDVLDFLHWKNPLHLKSLPDIDHAHILAHATTATNPDSSDA
jgi:Protein of unknown function (DUF3605)